MDKLPSIKERWKDILWYEWHYKISNYGNVISIKKWNKLLKLQKGSNGYIYVNLSLRWKCKPLRVHRLVWQAFLWLDINFTDYNTSMCVCHKDDDKSNNHISNLFLWSYKDNINDMINKWRKCILKGINHPQWWNFWKDSPTSKSVIQYSMEWLFIRMFYWISEANRITNINLWHISSTCRGNRRSAGGYKRSFLS